SSPAGRRTRASGASRSPMRTSARSSAGITGARPAATLLGSGAPYSLSTPARASASSPSCSWPTSGRSMVSTASRSATEAADQHLKNAASRRLVPAHSGLVALGFLQYVVERRAAGDRRLFPDLRKTGHGYGQSVSRWFGEWRRERGITSHLTPLHSFRNTVISRLRAAGVPLDVVQEITGHENDS